MHTFSFGNDPTQLRSHLRKVKINTSIFHRNELNSKKCEATQPIEFQNLVYEVNEQQLYRLIYYSFGLEIDWTEVKWQVA